jgi:hypothetical protein
MPCLFLTSFEMIWVLVLLIILLIVGIVAVVGVLMSRSKVATLSTAAIIAPSPAPANPLRNIINNTETMIEEIVGEDIFTGNNTPDTAVFSETIPTGTPCSTDS